MAHSQVRILYPEVESLPILEFRKTNNRYFVLTPPKNGMAHNSVKMELCQYGYEPMTGFLMIYRPIKVEEKVVSGWKKDAFGKWQIRPTFKRWRQVEFRELEPGELAALEREIGNITTARRKFEAQRMLQHFRDENYVRAAEKYLIMGEATSPSNPVILPDRARTQMVVTK